MSDGKVIWFNVPPSATERERERFERWAGSQLRADERSSVLARSVGGSYVLATARAAWAAWQARGLLDGGQPFDSEHKIT